MPHPSTDINRKKLSTGTKLALRGLLVNAVLATVKVISGIVGHSYALIADGVESCLDVFGSLAVVSGLKLAAEPPDENHPYGHGKAEPLTALLIAFALIAAAIILAIISFREILSEAHRPPAPFTLIVLIAVIAVKETLYRLVSHANDEIKSLALRADAWHHRSDAFTSAAAFIGIAIAVVGGDQFATADEWAALVACSIIAFNGYRLLRPALAEIMDEAPSPAIRASIAASARSCDGVLELDTCRVRKMGLEYYVDLHIRVPGNLTVLQGHHIAHQVKDTIRSSHTEVCDVLVHVEPESDDIGRSIQA